ncbi:tripartite motif-containing protein 16-like [Sinocyclocheilus rhinocerous]|uniref:tripartite motif-containing protein 16-like n=1 Tax=Sinocyclocheilus rhinocerous TaxID=307959 RepID=UPI0007BA92EB|nr:PREDICTED: tripartite motif-containing protein 16-like [Sinocyclocheilus rhinocerous]
MAEASIPVDQDQFMCPVCLDLLKDPVTTACGHSYCKICITDCWDQEDQKGVYSCPQCRQSFGPRPALATNVLLAEMLEKLKKTRLQTADSDAGSGDVQCDVCTETKLKAVKSCLVCLNSYCQNHLEQHQSFFRSKKHKLTEATGRLQEMICTKHEEPLKLYCRTDQRCICYPCVMDEHKNHETVTAEAERNEKQRILKETQVKYHERIQQRDKELEELREAVESHKRSAQTAVEDSERIFTELIRSIERSRSELIRLIRDQEKTAVSRAEGRLERLEQEINDLRRRDAELEQLEHTQDHIQFLQSFSVSPETAEQPSITISPHLSFSHVEKSVSKLKEKLEEFCKEEIEQISGRVSYSEIIPLKELKTRPEFLQYCRFLTLDPNTVNEDIRLSEGNRAATYTETVQSYPDHPDRFDDYLQVLCRESVCGRCYWELQWSGRVFISVSYKSISRKGWSECGFGYNDESWSLRCSSSRYSFIHNNIETDLSVKSISSRIGVFVDHSAGTLSFYSVSDTMSLIHTVQTTFTQTLCPGFMVGSGSSVKLCDLTAEIET